MTSDGTTAPPEGRLIRSVRERAIPKISIRAAAARIGISPEHWGNIERGYKSVSAAESPQRVEASAELLAKMAGAVGATAGELENAGDRPDAAKILREMKQHEPAPAPVPEFPWTPSPAYLSDEEMEAATPLATDILIKILQDGRDPETLTGYDLFPDDPGLGSAWDSVRQKWAWKYAVWQVASGAAKYAADRGRRRAGGRGALVPG